MKVYVVFQNGPDEHELVGVYSNAIVAREVSDKYTKFWDGSFVIREYGSVEEIELDKRP